MKNTSKLATIACLAAIASTAQAVTLVEVDFSGSANAAVGTLPSTNPQFTTINSAITFDQPTEAFSSVGTWNLDGTGAAATNTDLFGSANVFGGTTRFDLDMGFAATGFEYTITSVELDIRASNDDGATFQFGYRDSGGTTQVIGSKLIAKQSGADPIGTYSIDLTSENLTATISSTAWNTTGTGELRFLFFDANNGADALNDNFQVDAIRVIGTATAVPEPSSYALLGGLLALSWVMVRRRK